MPAGENTSSLLEKLREAVLRMDDEEAITLSERALAEGIDAYTAIMDGLAEGMNRAGELYDRGDYYVPELLLCSDALYAGLDILRPHISVDRTRTKGTMVIGVVEGDVHDIGKNLVKTMFEAKGWEVHDLGKDVKIERFAEEQQRTGAVLVGLSALMTTSMLAMPKIIEILKTRDPDVTVVVGGAPLTSEIAGQYGADGYAQNAKNAVHVAAELMEGKGLR